MRHGSLHREHGDLPMGLWIVSSRQYWRWASSLRSSWLDREPLLYGVSPREPRVLAPAALFVAVTGRLALHIPARRASRLDPIQALRYD